MEDILSEIIANKRKEVDLQKQAISIEQLSEGIGDLLPTRSMKQAIASSPTVSYTHLTLPTKQVV